ncbi:MAG: hypothetical protein AAB437_01420 [Patescibacteria group bacterium]
METFTTIDIIKIFREKNISLFTLADFQRLFDIKNQNSLYKKIQRLEKNKIIQKLLKGKYFFLLGATDDYYLANFLYQPSYISLESALSFYGIISGFAYTISSITIKKTRTFSIAEKEYKYSKINRDLFWGYEKKEKFLIAEKEKALLDYLYFYCKGLKTVDWEDLDLKEINKKKLLAYCKRFKNSKLSEVIKRKIL